MHPFGLELSQRANKIPASLFRYKNSFFYCLLGWVFFFNFILFLNFTNCISFAGGGFRMGNTCIPVADSFWYLAKLTQFVKFKNKIKFKINTHTHTQKTRTNISNLLLSAQGASIWFIWQQLKKTIYWFLYLTAPHLSYSMWDLVPWPGIEPGPPALGVESSSLNHLGSHNNKVFFQINLILV